MKICRECGNGESTRRITTKCDKCDAWTCSVCAKLVTPKRESGDITVVHDTCTVRKMRN